MTEPEPTEPELPELHFRAGLPGFPEACRFALVRWGDDDDDNPFSLLRSLDDPDLAFVVVPPALFFADYTPEIDDDSAERLGLDDPDDALVLVVVTLGDRPADATANLAAPVVVNQRNREGAQVVLRTGDHDLRARIVPA